jgi:16S rRNA (adenine1518-N6/adenine1519-N6)-dimethyltransferase
MKRSKVRLLGQHMITDWRILRKLISVSEIRENELVYEAGTGEGSLTSELCKRARAVVSFEIDRELFRKAKELMPVFPNLRIINTDVFKLQHLEFDVFISNLPYSRTREAVQWLTLQKFNRAIITVQKDFADKLKAEPGNKNYRSITALTQYCFLIKKMFDVPRRSFDPEPSVESSVIKLVPKEAKIRITKATIGSLNLLFSRRHKEAVKVLRKYNCKLELDLNRRKKIAELTPSQLIQAAQSV